MGYGKVDWRVDPYMGDSDRAMWEPYYEGMTPPFYPADFGCDYEEDDEDGEPED